MDCQTRTGVTLSPLSTRHSALPYTAIPSYSFFLCTKLTQTQNIESVYLSNLLTTLFDHHKTIVTYSETETAALISRVFVNYHGWLTDQPSIIKHS